MKKVLLCMGLAVGLLGIVESGVYAMDECCRPFGGYSRGPGWGWYGSPRPVETVKDTRAMLQGYYANDNVTVGRITERKGYFEAEIKDSNGVVVDTVIVDRRSGRIRSIQ